MASNGELVATVEYQETLRSTFLPNIYLVICVYLHPYIVRLLSAPGGINPVNAALSDAA